MHNTVYPFEVKTIDGSIQTLEAYKGKVLLIVNVASKCGLTPQYEGLQALYDKYRDQGLEILGFPCNQFAGQEPGTDEDIKTFCSATYGVDFPMFRKIDVNGSDAHPLYKFLKKEKGGALGIDMIKWNFTKFLVDRQGRVVERYAPTTPPADLEEDIQKQL